MPKITKEGRARKFIEVWHQSDTVREVARVLKIRPATASRRAELYRKHGIPLKKMPRGAAGVDWKALADYAKDLDAKKG